MAQQPDNQSCGTCMYFINATCRRKLPEFLTPGHSRWVTCDASEWCFYWHEVQVPPTQPAPPA